MSTDVLYFTNPKSGNVFDAKRKKLKTSGRSLLPTNRERIREKNWLWFVSVVAARNCSCQNDKCPGGMGTLGNDWAILLTVQVQKQLQKRMSRFFTWQLKRENKQWVILLPRRSRKRRFFFWNSKLYPTNSYSSICCLVWSIFVFRAQSERDCYGKIGSSHFKGPP